MDYKQAYKMDISEDPTQETPLKGLYPCPQCGLQGFRFDGEPCVRCHIEEREILRKLDTLERAARLMHTQAGTFLSEIRAIRHRLHSKPNPNP